MLASPNAVRRRARSSDLQIDIVIVYARVTSDRSFYNELPAIEPHIGSGDVPAVSTELNFELAATRWRILKR